MSFQKACTQEVEARQACFRKKSLSIVIKATDQRLRAEIPNPPSVAFCSRKAKISFAGQKVKEILDFFPFFPSIFEDKRKVKAAF